MVAQFNKRGDNQGIPREEMGAVCAELRGTDGELANEKFGVLVVRVVAFRPRQHRQG